MKPILIYEEIFKNLVQNKSVIIVGPSRKLVGLNRGSEIDSYDVVVRMNQGYKLPKAAHIDFGTRTDVLYHCLHSESVYSLEGFKKAGIKCVGIITNNAPNMKCQTNFNRFVSTTENLFPYHIMDLELYKTVMVTLRRPTTGIRAIVDLLSCGAKSVHVTGCDFHRSGYYSGYNNKTEQAVLAEQAYNEAHGRHNFNIQTEYIKMLVANDPRFSCDDILTPLLPKFVSGEVKAAWLSIKSLS